MPPEETNCLIAMRMDIYEDKDITSGVRVFAKENDEVAAVSWYTATSEPPTGYESILDGLVFVQSSTISYTSKINDITPTKVGSTYQWKDNAHPLGLMIAIALPLGFTLEDWQPQLEEAKKFQDRIAIYWHLFPSNPSDNQADNRVTASITVKPSSSTLDKEVERLNRAIILSHTRPTTVPYDVALSFAGENRHYVQQVAEELVAKGVKVFYDKFEEADLWGKDLYSHLADVYNGRARFTIMFVSKAYASKLWTNHERKAAQAKAFTQNSEYILPVRFDDTEIPGMLPTTNYLLASEKTPSQLASLLVKKLTTSRVSNMKLKETDTKNAKTKKSKNKDPIVWDFVNNILGMAKQKEGETRVWKISNFHVDGINTTKEPITKISGYLRNDVTGEHFPLKLSKSGNIVDFSEMQALPSNEKFSVFAFFGDEGNIKDYSAYKGIE